MVAGDMPRPPTVFVFAPAPLLTVTVEASADGADVHLHAGGQGLWMARMAADLGADVRVSGPLGGEVGEVIAALARCEGITLRPTLVAEPNGAYVHDRRGGSRAPVAEMIPRSLARHELDDLYSTSLAEGISADVAVLGGSQEFDVIPADVYARLAADLRAVDVPVVADLSGDALAAALDGGLTVLKVSHEELAADGKTSSDRLEDLAKAMRGLAERAQYVVVSRSADPALALVEDRLLEIVAPPLRQVDHHGAGDSMTAAIAVGLAGGLSIESALKLGAAAGALNVTRHGLGSGQSKAIQQLAEHVQIRALS
jgi:1-phosphofructokinase